MRSIFAITITFFLLTACSSPQVTVTSEVPVTLLPTSTSLPIPTGTPEPSVTSTSTPAVVKFDAQTWAGNDIERSSFLATGGQIDNDKGVAWNQENGRVYFAKDAKGEWISYPDGNVPIPPGPGFENEPTLNVPIYHDFTAAMTAITNELPWGELAETYREAQVNASKKTNDTYWKPIRTNGTWDMSFYGDVDIHSSENPNLRASIWVAEMQLPGGQIGMRVNFLSADTDYFHKDILISNAEDATSIYNEIIRIDQCVKDNKSAPNLAELCASSLITVASPNP